MIENVIYLLITLCIIAIVIYLVIYVLEVIGVTLPAKVVQLLWVIFALIVILLLLRIIMGGGGLHLGKWGMTALTMLS